MPAIKSVTRIIAILMFVCLVPHSTTLQAQNFQDTTQANHAVNLHQWVIQTCQDLKVQNRDMVYPKPRQVPGKTPLFLLGLALLLIFSIARQTFPNSLEEGKRFSLIGLLRRSNVLQTDADQRLAIGMSLFWYLGLAYLIFQLLSTNEDFLAWHGLPLFGFCFAGILCFFIVRNALLRLLGWIFKGMAQVDAYLKQQRQLFLMGGIILFPLCLCSLVTIGRLQNAINVLGICMALLVFAYLYYRQRHVLTNWLRLSFLHILLYLCAFEVMPVLILIHWLS